MGKTNQLGVLADVFTSDASNNVGIGGSPSGSYKLEVTGTAKVSGATYLASGGAANVGIGTATSNAALDIAVDAAVLNYPRIYDSRTQAADRGAKLNLGGYSDSLTTITSFGQIVGAKTNATSGNTSGYLSFLTNNGTSLTEKLRITDTGNVGIGTSSPSAKLEITNGRVLLNNGYSYQFYNTSSVAVDTLQMFTDGNVYLDAKDSTGGNLIFRTSNSNTERMRILAAGNILMNQSGGYSAETLQITSTILGGTQYGILISGDPSTYTNVAMRFHYTGVTVSGSISFNTSTTSYNTTSDYRLKQDFKDYNALDLVLAIKTYDYEWKGDKTRMYGVIAHELAEVLPYTILGEKDALNEDGTINPQGVDYSKLTPILVKAIQELSAQNQDLKSRLDKAGL